MLLSPSAHVDSFAREHLPTPEQWPELVFDLPELAYPTRLNCAEELLEASIARYGSDRTCLRAADGTVWTYEQVRESANRIARVLTEDLGLVPGNRVLLRGPNNPMLVATWFGVLRAGGVVVTTMPLLRAGELRTIAEICGPTIALCDARFTDDLVKAELDGLALTTYGGSGPDDLTVEGELWEHEYFFVRGGKTVAAVSKRWWTMADTYGVDVLDDEDHVLILASTVVIDLVQEDERG